MTDQITIPFNKTKTALLLIVPLFLLISGIVAILSPASLASTTSDDLEKIKLLGMAGGAIGLLLSILTIRKWLIQKTGFTIDQSGITDLSNASYTGLVEWKDITKIEEKKVGPIKLIILHTNNPQKYINQAKKTAVRQMKKNQGFYGSPLLIVSSRLKISYENLATLLKKEFEKSKG